MRPKSDDARWSRISFDINCAPHQAPSVKSVGITGQLTGSRADLMILDDIEVPNNSLTELMREKLLQLCTEAESILTPKEDSRILYLGTPQTTFTIYRKLAERNYRPFVWPARYPKDTKNYEGLLAIQLQEDIDNGAISGNPTDPDRFNSDDLLEREASMGRSNFMLQFMLDTSLSDAEKFPLKPLTLSLPLLTLLLLPNQLYGAQTHQTLLKTYPQSVSQEITFILLCNSLGTGTLTPKQSAVLTRQVEEQTKQQPLSYLNEMASSTCMKCVLTETATLTTPC